jgi:DNA mismatch repair protein MutL
VDYKEAKMESKLHIIKELPQHVADKIAAGEVVDRPISVVKELIENAIDAGADTITVEIKNGGKTYIRVTDNGTGIYKTDLSIAFKRHATSKIATEQDLDHILTLGFRGEALSSISAVSKVEMITKTRDEKAGRRIAIEGGRVSDIEEIGCPDGTTIIVSNLFFNTPARLKFMKPDAAESGLIIDFISKIAIAYPRIKLRLINNGSILFSTSGKGNTLANIQTIFSKETSDKLIQVLFEDGPLKIKGYISTPENTRISKKNLIFFINGRYISSKLVESAVINAYKEKISIGRYPTAILFINLPPNELDVNIHPNKKEVRFEDEKAMQIFLETALLLSLKSENAIAEITEKNVFKESIEALDPTEVKLPAMHQFDIKTILKTRRTAIDYQQQSEFFTTKNEQVMESVREPLMRFDIPALNVMGSLFGAYITAADSEYFYLIDQHAAHERIFYEELLAQYYKETKDSQKLLAPFIITVSPMANDNEAHWISMLYRLGFEIEEFGPRTFIIKSVPIFMSIDEAKTFSDDFIEHSSETSDFESSSTIERLISKACKSAVKGNDVLHRSEMERLLIDLAQTKNPFSCPHGRPIFIKLSKHEIEKMFKRV